MDYYKKIADKKKEALLLVWDAAYKCIQEAIETKQYKSLHQFSKYFCQWIDYKYCEKTVLRCFLKQPDFLNEELIVDVMAFLGYSTGIHINYTVGVLHDEINAEKTALAIQDSSIDSFQPKF